MKVKMLDSETGRITPDGPILHFRAGEVHEVPDAVGEQWLAIGLAEKLPKKWKPRMGEPTIEEEG